ncbi:MAG: AAA family ATPase [Xenococcaceae cyanobacterium MO_207.B15]|nr:AAA family ATPase [Xenococcaceae cyanobacterium MO_207.B15]
MRANPGGAIAPEDVIGRDKLIHKIWEHLEQQSVILSAERRMGKTTVIKKMEAEAPSDKVPIYRDLEGLRTPIEFVEAIWQDVAQYLSKKGKTSKKVLDFLRQLNGAEVNGFKFPEIEASHWKTLLTNTIEDLVSNQESQIILLWDEMPYMLNNMGDEAAMEMLDILRSLRQTYPDVRMVFTGSIGLHHIIDKLRQVGYTNDPINDMYPIDIPPLSSEDATDLTIRLIKGEEIATVKIQTTAKEIAEAVDCIPFYIQHLVSDLKFKDGVINQDIVERTISDYLINPLNPWRMEHYRDRIDNYYESQQKQYALNILDILAVEPPLSFNDLWKRLALNSQTQNQEMTRDILRLLLKDYYLVQQNQTFGFRYGLVKNYWALSRGL